MKQRTIIINCISIQYILSNLIELKQSPLYETSKYICNYCASTALKLYLFLIMLLQCSHFLLVILHSNINIYITDNNSAL